MPGGIVPVRLPSSRWRFSRSAPPDFASSPPATPPATTLPRWPAWLTHSEWPAGGATCSEQGRLLAVRPALAADWPRVDAWRRALGVILFEMGKVPLPVPARAALDRLGASASIELEACADALLAGVYDRIDPAAAPFVGAALQVYWTALASAVPAEGLGTPSSGVRSAARRRSRRGCSATTSCATSSARSAPRSGT